MVLKLQASSSLLLFHDHLNIPNGPHEQMACMTVHMTHDEDHLSHISTQSSIHSIPQIKESVSTHLT